MSPISTQSTLIAASDCHLVSINEERTSDFLSLCSWVRDSTPEYFLLLGDVFDFALGSKKYYQKKYQKIGDALEEIAASGTKVIYLEGNHEADVKHFPWKGITFVPEGTFFIQLQNEFKIQMAHGDLIYSHKAYRRFRAIVKSSLFKFAVRLLPGKIIDRLFLKSSEISRAQDKNRTFNHKELITHLADWLKDGKSQFGLFGHFHQPYAEKTSGTQGQLISVDSWNKPNFLSFENGEFYRYFLKNGKITQKVKASSILSSCQNYLK